MQRIRFCLELFSGIYIKCNIEIVWKKKLRHFNGGNINRTIFTFWDTDEPQSTVRYLAVKLWLREWSKHNSSVLVFHLFGCVQPTIEIIQSPLISRHPTTTFKSVSNIFKLFNIMMIFMLKNKKTKKICRINFDWRVFIHIQLYWFDVVWRSLAN